MEQLAIRSILQEIFEKLGRDFLSVSQVGRKLNAKTKKSLGLSAKPNGAEIERALAPHLGDQFLMKKGSRSKFLLVNRPWEEIALSEIRRAVPGKTPGQIGQYTPFTKPEFAGLLNQLLADGKIRVELKPDYGVRLFACETSCVAAPASTTPSTTPLPTSETLPAHPKVAEPAIEVEVEATPSPQDEIASVQASFRETFQQVAQGRIFIPIFEIRRRLTWPRERFDVALSRLWDQGVIQLHAGDVASMTEDEVRECYMDQNGFLLLTMTWRGS